MEKKSKKKLGCILVILIFVLPPLIFYMAMFMPRIYYFSIDRQRVSEEFNLDLTDDVKLVSYKDDSFLVAIDTELVVEVDDAERFLQNNVKFDLIKYLPGNFFDYKSRGDEHISIRIEPHHGKYRVHLYHSE